MGVTLLVSSYPILSKTLKDKFLKMQRVQGREPMDPQEEAARARQGVKESVALFSLTVLLLKAVPFVLNRFA